MRRTPRSLVPLSAVALVALLGGCTGGNASQQAPPAPIVPPVISTPAGSAAVEQTAPGRKPAAALVEHLDGLGVGFEGPQGTATVRNPSDNSLAVGPGHIVQTVNSRMAVFTRQGERFDTTGRVLYGPVNTNNVFRGAGGACEAMNNGDAVVRYDQLARRWLIVMPIFRRTEARPDQPAVERCLRCRDLRATPDVSYLADAMTTTREWCHVQASSLRDEIRRCLSHVRSEGGAQEPHQEGSRPDHLLVDGL